MPEVILPDYFYGDEYILSRSFIPFLREVFSVQKKTGPSTEKDLTKTQKVHVTVHHADDGPSLESRMIFILSSHLSKSTDF